ncbi:MAG TPA: rRNA maturation RNase YbeY [Patescibacteria group bacterium]|nr:rRNA maturation RNase YbeY [Patescibacteria group bacterium]
MILIFSHSRFKINRRAIQKSIGEILKKEGRKEKDSLNIIFVGVRKMRQIGLKLKNEKKAYPVLSFSYLNDEMQKDLIGEIVICYPQAVLLAAEREKRVHAVIMQLIEHGVRSLR